MSDFYQHGLISTLHRLNGSSDHLQKELKTISRRRTMALVLPSLFSELQGSALKQMINELKHADYLREIVISMNRMNGAQFRAALKFFDKLPQPHRIIWNDGPRMRRIYGKLRKHQLVDYIPGKGFNVWMAYGYLIGKRNIDVVVTHDCDVLTYDRSFLARLIYPVASTSLAYEFSKGYYARVSDRMYGRVARLLVTPLVRSLIRILGHHPLLTYLDNFRYPLSGEFAMSIDLANAIRIPGDWGLEIGILAEVYRNTTTRRVCQIDLVDRYDHKHQILSKKSARRGLRKMAFDISKSLFQILASEGLVINQATFTSLLSAYIRTAQDTMQRYQDDAVVNDLTFDQHEESVVIEVFVDAIESAARVYMNEKSATPLTPTWSRVESAIPGFMDELRQEVEKDNAL